MYPAFGLQDICNLFGYSRQAHYKYHKREKMLHMQGAIVLQLVEEIRTELPGIGTKKLHHLLQHPLQQHHIKIGRDKLFDLLADHGMLIRRKKRRKPITTNSSHPFFKYSNLVKGLVLTRANQVWVSDITYIHIADGYGYLSLITDAFSRKILGYHLHDDLSSEGAVKALQMALCNCDRNTRDDLIHHSDRGIQYCCYEYTGILKQHFVGISMTQNGDPYENALAERINGILKTEFNLHITYRSLQHASDAVAKAIKNYNELRPHLSLQLQTPQSVHQKQIIQ